MRAVICGVLRLCLACSPLISALVAINILVFYLRKILSQLIFFLITRRGSPVNSYPYPRTTAVARRALPMDKILPVPLNTQDKTLTPTL